MDMNCVDFAPSATSNSRRHIGILIKFHGGNPLHGILVFLPKHVSPSRSLYLEAPFSYPFVFRRGVGPPTQAFLFTPLSYFPEDRVGQSPAHVPDSWQTGLFLLTRISDLTPASQTAATSY
ncbi:hypothetical protein J3F84DRAFT_127718 [Trichoderma pleuroticola]